MNTWSIAETFVSINGEGKKAGELALFIRFKGCNLNCTWCDTVWAAVEECPSVEWRYEEIIDYVKKSGIDNITLTGGEPLLQPGIKKVIEGIMKVGKSVEIETNGSISIKPFTDLRQLLTGTLSFTVDSKLSGSGCKSKMHPDHLLWVGNDDSVKFVVSSQKDLDEALELIDKHGLSERTQVFFSPCFGTIALTEIVAFMKAHQLNKTKLQIQMHKVIWEPNAKGV